MHVTSAEEDPRSREIDDDGYDINEIYRYTSKSAESDYVDPFSKDIEFVKSLDGLNRSKKRSLTTLQKRHQGVTGVGSKKVEEHIVTGYNAFDVVAPPHNLDHLAKLYEKSTAHKAAVDAKTSNIVGLGYDFIPNSRVKLKMDKFDEKKAERYQQKLSQWKIELTEAIDDMNEDDSFTETLTKVWKDYEATGNGYIEIGRSETTGEIAFIGHVPCTTVRIRKKRDGFVQIIANQATFFRNFGKKDTDPIGGDPNPNELIHIKRYSPASSFYGVPDIIPAMPAVAGIKFSSDFNLDYFENKAVPRHIVILKGATINPRLAKNILEFFETGLKGQNHRSLFVPLPGDTKEKKVEFSIEPVEAGVQDASFNNYRKANLQEILMAHRVPINKIGLPEGVSLAVARDADKTFKEQVCGPEQDMFETKLNKIVKDIQGENWVFELSLNELTLTDEATQSQIDERRIKTGTETPNEQRIRRGQPAHPKGNELFDINAKANQAQAAAENRAQGNRERDSQRSASRTDSAGEGRNAKGEGRTNGTG